MDRVDRINHVICWICNIPTDEVSIRKRTQDLAYARIIIARILLDNKICTNYDQAGKVVGVTRQGICRMMKKFDGLLRRNKNFRFNYHRSISELRKQNLINL